MLQLGISYEKGLFGSYRSVPVKHSWVLTRFRPAWALTQDNNFYGSCYFYCYYTQIPETLASYQTVCNVHIASELHLELGRAESKLYHQQTRHKELSINAWQENGKRWTGPRSSMLASPKT